MLPDARKQFWLKLPQHLVGSRLTVRERQLWVIIHQGKHTLEIAPNHFDRVLPGPQPVHIDVGMPDQMDLQRGGPLCQRSQVLFHTLKSCM